MEKIFEMSSGGTIICGENDIVFRVDEIFKEK